MNINVDLNQMLALRSISYPQHDRDLMFSPLSAGPTSVRIETMIVRVALDLQQTPNKRLHCSGLVVIREFTIEHFGEIEI